MSLSINFFKRVNDILLFTLFFYSSSIYSAPLIKFNRLNISQGLPDRTIWDIKQSADGLLWYGTSKGLVSYDGYTFKTYSTSNIEDKNTESNVIRTINIDSEKRILVGHYAGLSKLNFFTGQLEKIQLQLKNQKYLSDLSVYSIYKSKNEFVWLGTDKGIVVLNNDYTKIIYDSSDNLFKPLSENRINTIQESLNGDILLGTNSGLFIYRQQYRELISVESHYKNLRIQTIIIKKNGVIIAGTKNGLFELKNNSLIQVAPELSNAYIYSLVENKNGELWIGTQDQGLYFLDENGNISQSKYSRSFSHSIADNDVYSLLIDHSETLWVGSFNAGLSNVNLKSMSFEYYTDLENSLYCLKSPVVYSVFEEKQNLFWLGTQHGLARINLVENDCKLFTASNDSKIVLSGIDILHLHHNNQEPNFLYVSTRNGLDKINLRELVKDNNNHLSTLKSIESIINIDEKTYAAGYFGIYSLDKTSIYPKKISSKNDELDSSPAYQILKSKNGKIFIASWKGLLTINADNLLENVNWDEHPFLTKPIRSLNIDSKNNLWIGIDNLGLFMFSEHGQLLKQFTNDSELHAIKGFSSIVESKEGLWISSINGVSHLSLLNDNIVNYTQRDGLSQAPYTNGAYYLSPDDRIYFGSRDGMTTFFPEFVTPNVTSPKLVLTDFIYFNKTLSEKNNKNKFVLPTTISNLTELSLSYKDYVFGFEFAALHYADSDKNQYAYMMDNWDEDWNYTTAKYRRATYSNLPAGDYVFNVKASNNHGVWNENPLTVKIKISPAPWLTIWAYTLYFIIFVLSISFFIWHRTKTLQKRAIFLEDSINQRTSELATEKQKVEQLLSRKNEEFANVSHEFRTPLTLILGPLAQVLKTNTNIEEINRLNIVQRNGYRLLRMVDQLLNMETFRVKAITNKSPQAFGKTIRLLAAAFADLAKEKDIELEIKNIADVNFEFTNDALEKIILNLLSNAVKYTKSGGSISVESLRTQNNELIIQINDTGIGIPADKIDSVFERYNRVLDENSEQVTGAGIGLALVKELVEAHQGRIEVKSQLGQGTSISIILPIIGEVEDNQVKTHSNDEIIAMELMSLTSQNIKIVDSETNSLPDMTQDKPTILVIEDNLDMRNYIVGSISEDYQIVTASNGEEGVEKAISDVPDLIISDVMMPKMDGYEATHTIRTNDITNHIPIILLTARGDRESRLKGWHKKADEYLTKPFDSEELKIRINNLLAIRNILKRRFSEVVFEVDKSSSNEQSSTSEITKNNLQLEFVNKLNKILEPLYINSSVSVAEIASAAAMSERQFFRKLNSVLDMTPSEYLRRFRLEKSKLLLEQGKTANYTAIEVGFSSQAYFSNCFKAQYGLSPTNYKKQKMN